MRKQHKIYTGEKYGDYIALEAIQYTTKNNTVEKQWKCIDDLGNIKYFRARKLTTLKSSEENKILYDKNLEVLVKNNKHQYGVRNKYYQNYKNNALSRNHIFELLFDDFNNVIIQNCYYCGQEPQFNDRWIKIEHKNQPKLAYNGIDRVDSLKGYTINNVVPCCSKCNLMKNIFTSEEFLHHISKIYNFSIQSSTTIPEGSTLK